MSSFRISIHLDHVRGLDLFSTAPRQEGQSVESKKNRRRVQVVVFQSAMFVLGGQGVIDSVLEQTYGERIESAFEYDDALDEIDGMALPELDRSSRFSTSSSSSSEADTDASASPTDHPPYPFLGHPFLQNEPQSRLRRSASLSFPAPPPRSAWNGSLGPKEALGWSGTLGGSGMDDCEVLASAAEGGAERSRKWKRRIGGRRAAAKETAVDAATEEYEDEYDVNAQILCSYW